MTIDEAIKRAEEVASDYDILVEQSVLEQNKHHHHKCAAEHRQLAKWLKDYKRLKEQEPTTKNDLGIDCIDRAQAQTEIEMSASRCTIAKERGGMGQVIWSDQIIKASDAVDIIRHLPSVTPQESCEDSVSRKAVLDTLDKMDSVLNEDRTVETYKELLTACYNDLPSATPEHKKEEVEKNGRFH